MNYQNFRLMKPCGGFSFWGSIGRRRRRKRSAVKRDGHNGPNSGQVQCPFNAYVLSPRFSIFQPLTSTHICIWTNDSDNGERKRDESRRNGRRRRVASCDVCSKRRILHPRRLCFFGCTIDKTRTKIIIFQDNNGLFIRRQGLVGRLIEPDAELLRLLAIDT